MDQLKKLLAVVKQQHFWILSGLAMLLGLIVYFISSSKLADAYQKQKQKIAGVDSGLNSLVTGTEHPNSKWVTRVQDETTKLRGNVRDAWAALYNDQLNRVFRWPAELGPTFIAAFSQPAAKDDRLRMLDLCERYQKFVKSEVRHMGAIVDADWPVEGKAEGRPRPGGGHGPARGADAAGKADAAEKTYTVVWDPADQQRLVDAYDWQDPPSPLDVRYAQEELWVTKAICEAIARTNLGAKDNEEATVREINQMLIGYDAVGKFPLGEGEKRILHIGKGPIAPIVAPAAGAGADANLVPFEPKRPDRHKGSSDDSDAGGRAVGGGHGGMGIVPAGGAPGGAPEVVDPDAPLKDGRFVNPAGKPLLAKDLQNPPVAEYNLMAFRLSLVVDEAKWGKLLLELANSPLPLEVREVRINVVSDNNDGGRAGVRRPHEGDSAGANGTMIHNITLELRGVAYLINPPNLQALGLVEAEGAPAAPAAIAPGPAAPPGAAATPAAPVPGGAPTTTPAASGAPADAVTPAPAGSPPPTGPAVTPPVSPPATPPPAGAGAPPAATK